MADIDVVKKGTHAWVWWLLAAVIVLLVVMMLLRGGTDASVTPGSTGSGGSLTRPAPALVA